VGLKAQNLTLHRSGGGVVDVACVPHGLGGVDGGVSMETCAAKSVKVMRTTRLDCSRRSARVRPGFEQSRGPESKAFVGQPGLGIFGAAQLDV